MIDFSSGDSAANAFTTGGTSTDRYSLNSVIVNYNSGFPPGQEYGQHTLSIHAANGSNSGAQIGNLNGTIPTGGGFTTYTASGITLNGGTRYFVQVNAPVAPDGAHQPAPDFGDDRFGDLRPGRHAVNDATGNDHLKQRESANNDGNALEHGINVGSTPASEPGHATLGHRCPRAHNPRRCQT